MEKELLNQLKSSISQDEVIDIIRKLVELPSYPGIKNQETNVAKCIKNIFVKEGIWAEVNHVINGRFNVIAKIEGKNRGKSLLLTGHTDTVPSYGMKDPCILKECEDKLYGRGTVDMKGPLACMIAALIAIKRSNVELDGDLIFAGVIDEEEGSLGTIDLLERGLDVDAAIVGEPSNLEICVAHRGLEWIEFHFIGKTVHGGKQDEGINAILNASNFIQRIQENVYVKIYSKTHSIIGTSSMNYGTINGGTQPSTVAGNCVMKIDRRWIPGEKYEDVLKDYQDIIDDMSKEDSKFKCEMKIVDESVMKEGYVHEAMETDINHPIVNISKKMTKKIYNKEPKLTFFPAWSDGGLLSSYGNIPTIIFAPGDLESAHSSEEFIDKSQVYPATLIYALIAIEFCRNE
ncbi:M20 family metallopeptidase [Clostridium sp. D2Q-14]|uniref:M20 family metallopeptidase n=1 Tax=Anaeromonas gelatinilytica TaxID=2683194 RepID=UPI00193AE6E2|nr:M20 family metallopeptidase [Anaeromonas gelatinilytica]MBS4536664.1 M20 family metallopeptidase [Anaeromonas gelatinilytica]